MKIDFDYEKLNVYQASIEFVSRAEVLIESLPKSLAATNSHFLLNQKQRLRLYLLQKGLRAIKWFPERLAVRQGRGLQPTLFELRLGMPAFAQGYGGQEGPPTTGLFSKG